MSRLSNQIYANVYARLAAKRRGLFGAAVLRVGFSIVVLTNYLWHFAMRDALWGPRGQVDIGTYQHLSGGTWFGIFALSGDERFATALLLISALSSVIYGLGIAPRVTCWPFLFTTYVTLDRTPFASDAGQNLILLIQSILCFMDTSAYFCLLKIKAPFKLPTSLEVIQTIVHNAGRFLIAWQVCMIYFWAAFWKLGGDSWRDGTAMFYVLEIERFQIFPWLSNIIAQNSVLVAILTYITIVFQMGFPFLMWDQRVKPYMVAFGVSLHLGIATLLGLVSFSAIMMLADLSILSDEQFEKIHVFFSRFFMGMGPKHHSVAPGD